jgi:hypothetical protein
MDLLDSGLRLKDQLGDRGLAIDKRMEYLQPSDRQILTLVLSGQVTRRGLATALGVSAATLARRLRRLLNRLHDPFIVAILNDGHFLPEGYRDAALAYYLRRWPIHRIARETHRSHRQIRDVLAFVRGWYGAKRTHPNTEKPR